MCKNLLKALCGRSPRQIKLKVAAECIDKAGAEAICKMLEANDIKAMIVDKDSPVYIKGNDSPVQIQVCRKDLEEANAIIQQ